jgi:hypothetical protein
MAAGEKESTDLGKEEPQEKFDFKVSHCRHDSGKASLRILIENHHIDLSAFSWAGIPGHQATWTIYDLTPDDVRALGNAILETSFRMKQEQEEAKVPPRYVDPEL